MQFKNFFSQTPPIVMLEWMNKNDVKYIQQYFSHTAQSEMSDELKLIHNRRIGGIYYYVSTGSTFKADVEEDDEGDWDDF